MQPCLHECAERSNDEAAVPESGLRHIGLSCVALPWPVVHREALLHCRWHAIRQSMIGRRLACQDVADANRSLSWQINIKLQNDRGSAPSAQTKIHKMRICTCRFNTDPACLSGPAPSVLASSAHSAFERHVSSMASSCPQMSINRITNACGEHFWPDMDVHEDRCQLKCG